MRHLDEGTIHAWLDGELPSGDGEAATAHVTSCAQCAAAVAEARGFKAASSRILTALDGVPGGVLPAVPRAPPMATRFAVPRAWMAVAAVLVLGIGTVIATRPRREAVPRKELRQELRARPSDSQPMIVAQAAPAAPPAAPAPRAPRAAPAAPAAPARSDSSPQRGAVAGQAVVVTGAGSSVARESVASTTMAEATAPQLLSRSTSANGGDTVITTIYDVHGVRVSLTDRSSQGERREHATSFSDAVMANAKAAVPAEHSLTWSDSAGRTRTLRGALSSAELQRLRERLFGSVP